MYPFTSDIGTGGISVAKIVGVPFDADEWGRPVKDLVELLGTESYVRGVVSGASSKVSFVSLSATSIGAISSLGTQSAYPFAI